QLRNLIFTYREQFRQSVAVQQKREIQAEVDRVLGLTTGEGPAGAIAASANTARQYEGNQPGFDLLRTRFTNEDGDTVFRKHVTVWFAHIVVPLLVVIGGVVLGGLSLFASTPSLGGVGVLVGGLMVVGGSVW